MSIKKLNSSLLQELDILKQNNRLKGAERVICQYIPASNGKGPRYKLLGETQEFLRMNSNSYLSLSNHPSLIKEAESATQSLGVGPGAVRFIDGTFIQHKTLEEKIAAFIKKPAAKIFNSG